jgi:hypothetical protein
MTTTISKDFLRSIREQMNAALASVAEKNGVVIQVGNASFTPENANFKLTIATLPDGADPTASASELKAAADWKNQAVFFGLKVAWLGKTFTQLGSTCEIVGLMPKRRKYPVLVRKNGKLVLFTEDAVKAGMGQRG